MKTFFAQLAGTLVGVIVGLTIGWLFWSKQKPVPPPSPIINGILRVQRVEIVAPDGETRGFFGLSKQGRPKLNLIGKSGAEFDADVDDAEFTSLTMYPPGGRGRSSMMLNVFPTYTAFHLNGKTGETTYMLNSDSGLVHGDLP